MLRHRNTHCFSAIEAHMAEGDSGNGGWLDRRFVTRGAVVLAPILVTLYVIFWLVQRIEAIPGMALLEVTAYDPVNRALQLAVFLFGGALLVALTGFLTGTSPGLRAEKALDRSMDRVPLLGRVYSLTKAASDTLFHGSDRLTDPVKLDFDGTRLTAYRTGNTAEDGREVLFLPTSPNVASGHVIEVEDEKFFEPDEPREKILKRTFSAGFGEEDDEDGKPERET